MMHGANVLSPLFFHSSGDPAEPGYDRDIGESGYGSYRGYPL